MKNKQKKLRMTKVVSENEDGGTAANGYDEGDVAGNQQKRQFLL